MLLMLIYMAVKSINFPLRLIFWVEMGVLLKLTLLKKMDCTFVSQVPHLTWKSVGCTIPKKHGTAADLPLRFWSLEAKDLFNFPTGFLMKWHLGGGSGKSAADVEWLYLCTQWMNRSEAKAKSLAETLTYPIFIAFSQCVTKWKLWKGPK